MNTRSGGEGWKEFKAGSIYDLIARPELDGETGSFDELWQRAQN
jgi:hypothetical protein